MASPLTPVHLFFRHTPFGGSYALAAGLGDALEWLRDWRFTEDDLAYLATLKGRNDQPLFEHGFLDYLRALRLTVDVEAVPEGNLVFAQEPLVRVQGPMLQAQLLETALLCIVNFQTLVATKAARVCSAAHGEPVIENLKSQGAKVGVWGVGTRLVTAFNQPALGGVYKLGAIRGPDGAWQHKLKLSEQAVKVPNPGILQVRRFRTAHGLVGDVIHDVANPAPASFAAVDCHDSTHPWQPPPEATGADLLVPVVRGGRVVHPVESLATLQQRARDQLSLLPAAMKRFLNPQPYFVGLENGLHETKLRLIAAAREHKGAV